MTDERSPDGDAPRDGLVKRPDSYLRDMSWLDENREMTSLRMNGVSVEILVALRDAGLDTFAAIVQVDRDRLDEVVGDIVEAGEIRELAFRKLGVM